MVNCRQQPTKELSTIKKRKNKLSATKLQLKKKSSKHIDAFLNSEIYENFKFLEETSTLCDLKNLNEKKRKKKKSINYFFTENERFGSTSTLGSPFSTIDSISSLADSADNDCSAVYSEILLTNLLVNDEHDLEDFPEWTKDEFYKLSEKQYKKSINFSFLFRSCNFDEMQIRKIFN
jgi:hypothetical protein